MQFKLFDSIGHICQDRHDTNCEASILLWMPSLHTVLVSASKEKIDKLHARCRLGACLGMIQNHANNFHLIWHKPQSMTDRNWGELLVKNFPGSNIEKAVSELAQVKGLWMSSWESMLGHRDMEASNYPSHS